MRPNRPERTAPLAAAIHERAIAGALALGCLAILGVGASLSPDPRGHATHESLGMPPCAWSVWFDQPCPTCGMTTSFAHAADGSWLGALDAQPLGAVLAVLTAAIFWGATHQSLTGSRIGSSVQELIRPRTMIALLVLGAGAWAYKIATWT